MIPRRYALNCTLKQDLISDTIQEVCSIVRAHEDDVLGDYNPYDIDLSRKLTSRGMVKTGGSSKEVKRVKFMTIAKELKDSFNTWMSIMYVEVYHSICYLYHRKREVFDLIEFARSVIKAIEDDSEDAADMLKLWAKSYTVYCNRYPNEVEAESFSVSKADSIIGTQNKVRLINRLRNIDNMLSRIAAKGNPKPSLTILKTEDVLLIKQRDYKPVLNGSFIEFFNCRKELGYGMDQLRDVHNECKKGDVSTIYNNLRIDFMNDFKDALTNALDATPRLRTGVYVSTAFYEHISHVFTNAIIDLSIMFHNYAKAQTDRSATVTVQFMALKTVLFNGLPNALISLSPLQMEALRNIIISHLVVRKARTT